MTEMHPDLVGAAGLQLNFQQGAAVLLPEHLVVGHRPLAVLPDTAHDALALGPADGQIDGAALRQPGSLANGVIGAADAVCRQLFFQPVGRQLVFGAGHQAGGAPIQPVDGPEGGILTPLGQMPHHPVAQSLAVVMARAGMHRKAGRLVEAHQIAVLIDHVQRPLHGLHPALFAAVGLPEDGQNLSRPDGMAHRHPDAVQRDAIFGDLQLPQKVGGHLKLPPQQGQHFQTVVFFCADVLQPFHGTTSSQYFIIARKKTFFNKKAPLGVLFTGYSYLGYSRSRPATRWPLLL